MALQIQQATIHDIEELAEIFNLYRVYYEQQTDVEGAKDFLFQRFEHTESIIFIAKEDNGKITGFTQLYPIFSSVSMQRMYILNDLFVREEHRGRGIGQQLLNAAKAYAVAAKAKGLQLETTPENTGAQKLYERFGFKKDTEFFHYFLKV